MKSVIKSLHPEVCERIASGEQTIIIAKSAPKEVPFKAYIYQTKKRITLKTFKEDCSNGIIHNAKLLKAHGKVIGEFICDKITPIAYTMDGFADIIDCKLTCLKPQDFINYGKGKKLYGWHISDLKIYDKPKELKEFYTRRSNKADNCNNCVNKKYWKKETEEIAKSICDPCQKDNFKKEVTHAPQSWLYAEKFSLYKGKVIDEPNEWVVGELKKYGYACYIKQTVEPTNSNCSIGTFEVIPETVKEIN